VTDCSGIRRFRATRHSLHYRFYQTNQFIRPDHYKRRSRR